MKASIDLGLAVIAATRQPDERMSLRGIAEVCQCSLQTIQHLQARALAKMRMAATNPALAVPPELLPVSNGYRPPDNPRPPWRAPTHTTPRWVPPLRRHGR